jgi:polyribonucleotide nucleotidyltransferase
MEQASQVKDAASRSWAGWRAQSQPREALAEHAPLLSRRSRSPEFIGMVIGRAAPLESSTVQIDIEEDGTILVTTEARR